MDSFPAADDGIADLPELALGLLVHHFQIAERGDAARTPVHDVVAAIDQPFFIEPHESFAHRARELLVHGEVLARPVDRIAQPLHLLEDVAAVVLLPLPDALEEGFAAHVAAVFAFAGKLALHHHLGGDAGVVGAGQPHASMPRMRCQRTMMSISVWLSMWPMCRRPVTLGGGSRMVKVSRAVVGVSAWKDFRGPNIRPSAVQSHLDRKPWEVRAAWLSARGADLRYYRQVRVSVSRPGPNNEGRDRSRPAWIAIGSILLSRTEAASASSFSWTSSRYRD